MQLGFLQTLNPFKLREVLKSKFPKSTNSELSALSESIFLSKRLKEKAFPFSFWNLSTHVFEQATDFRVAEFHSDLLKPYGTHILDGCGGAGFDSLAFINSGFNVTTTEVDHTHCSNLEKNLAIYNLGKWKVIGSSFLNLNPNDFSVIYLDPMRRKGTGRFVELEDYQPSFSEILNWLPSHLPALIKVSPLLNITEKLKDDFKLIFVGLDRECKEVLLARNFKNLGSENLFISEMGKIINLEPQSTNPEPLISDLEQMDYIYEPHAALLKSNRQTEMAASLNLRKPASDCGYFFGNNISVEHLYERYHLIDKQYFKLSSISDYLRNNLQYNFIFKKKNSNVDLEIYSKKYKWKKGQKGRIIFISEVNGKAVFWVGQEIE